MRNRSERKLETTHERYYQLKKEAGMTSHDAVLSCARFWEPRRLVMVGPWIQMWWVFCLLRWVGNDTHGRVYAG